MVFHQFFSQLLLARGKMEIINVVCPPFDPKDEYVVA